MACEKRRKKSQLAECTNTPHISRPRKSCGSHASPSTTKQNVTIQSPQPKNPLIDANYPLTGSNDSQNKNEGHLRVKSSFATPTTVLPAVGSYRTPQCAEDGGQNNRVYSKHRERGETSLQATSSCPPLGRGSLKSKRKTAKSIELENQSKNFEDLLVPGGGIHEKKEPLRVDINDKESLTTPELVHNFQYLDGHEDTDCRNTRVYSKRRQRECRSSEKVSFSCPPLGRAVIESKEKTGTSYKAKNLSKNFEDSLTPARSSHDQSEVSLSGNDICRENLSTPQPCLAAIDSFHFPGDNVDANFQNVGVQSMLQGSNCRSFEKVSLSCPPLGRAVCKSPTGERHTKVRKNSSLRAWDDLPVTGIPKMRAPRRRNSVPVNEAKYSLPENFVQEQRAHFAEVDAFVLQEEDSSDAD